MNENKIEGQDEIQTETALAVEADQTLLGVGSGKWNFKNDILYYGNKKIAELYQEVDGYYFLNYDGLAQGCYSAHVLKEIGECIDIINKPWNAEVNEVFKELNARSDT